MKFWWVMIVAGILTYATRLSFILLFGKFEAPEWLRRGLHYVPPAVLSAIIVPEVLIQAGKMNISQDNARLPAALLAILVAWKTKNAVLTILVGMATLWIWRGFF